MAAAQEDEESNSVARSASGRFAGGIFTQAVVNELFRAGSSSEQTIEYKDWTDNVTNEMNQLFAVGANPKFSARDDSWDVKYDEATGIQKATYSQRYAALPLVSPNPDPEGLFISLAGHNPIAGRLNALCDTNPSNHHISALVAQFLDPSLPYPKPFT